MAQTAVVTGGSGYIASEVIKQLLEKGYNVRATVRSTSNKEKTAHLTTLGEALPGNITLYEADLLKPGSFDEVIRGADFVLHTASPFIRTVNDPQKELVEPALEGTKNVLGSVVKHKSTVKRVVLTSSFAAIIKPISGPSKPPRYTEEDWNTDSTLETGAYRVSKTLSEKAAWKLAEGNFELAVINPTFVLGPILSARTDATSIMNVSDFIEGKSKSLQPWVCDVRDIGRAHVLAIEKDSAKGQRFLVSQANTTSPKYYKNALEKAFPGIQLPDLEDSESKPVLDNNKALKVLGLEYLHDPESSIVDMTRTLIQRGVSKPSFS